MAVTWNKHYDGFTEGAIAIDAFSNNWMSFRGQSDAVRAEVRFNDGTTEKTFEVSPDINGDFYFNIVEAITSYFNHEVDAFAYSDDVTNPSNLVKEISIGVTVKHTSSPDDVSSFAANTFTKSKAVIPNLNYVTTQKKLTPKLVEFVGYPFSVTVVEETSGDVVRYAGSDGTKGIWNDDELWDDSEAWDDNS